MKKAIAIFVAVLFVFALTSISFAAEKKAEEKAPAKVKRVTGEVGAVDAKAGTLTVKSKKKEVTLSTDAKTTVKVGKEKKALADLKVGDKVKAIYTEVDGKNVAKSVVVITPELEKKMEKKMEKKAAPKPAE